MQLSGEYADWYKYEFETEYRNLEIRTSTFTPAQKLTLLLDLKSVKQYAWLSYTNLYRNEAVNFSYFM